MYKLSVFALSIVFLSACSSSKEEIVQDKSSEKSIENTVLPNQLLSVDISGMSCEMACGGSIRKGLLETGAVARVQFVDFEMDNETNSAKIYFDNSKISENKIIEVISELNEKQFAVTNPKLEEIVQETPSTHSKKNASAGQKSTTEVSTQNIELPNLLDLIRSLILN